MLCRGQMAPPPVALNHSVIGWLLLLARDRHFDSFLRCSVDIDITAVMTMFVVSAPIGAPARAARTAFLPRLCRWRAPHSHARLPSHTRLPCHASLPSPQGPGPSDESLGLESPPSLLPPPQPRLDDNVDTSLDAPTPGIASNSEPLNPSVLFGEFLSTFLLVFLSLKLNNAAPSGGPFPDAAVITALAASFIPVSGAHFNPAVTIALMVTNRVPVSRALAFVVAQLAASCTAAFGALAFGVQLAPPTITATTKLALARAAASEFTPMFFIVSVVYLTAVATPREGGVGVQLAPFYIGLAVFICINAFPGATFNPARAFGPALLGNATPFHWVLWIPPILGAITAATVRFDTFPLSLCLPLYSLLTYLNAHGDCGRCVSMFFSPRP